MTFSKRWKQMKDTILYKKLGLLTFLLDPLLRNACDIYLCVVKLIIFSDIPNKCVIIQDKESIHVPFRKCKVLF